MSERTFLLAKGGCSFCGKADGEYAAAVRITDGDVNICDECIDLCFGIFAEETGLRVARNHGSLDPNERVQLVHLLADKRDHRLANIRELLNGVPSEFGCSFCGANRIEVPRLISGPRIFICEACVLAAGRITGQTPRG